MVDIVAYTAKDYGKDVVLREEPIHAFLWIWWMALFNIFQNPICNACEGEGVGEVVVGYPPVVITYVHKEPSQLVRVDFGGQVKLIENN